jgi:hypothetical protein
MEVFRDLEWAVDEVLGGRPGAESVSAAGFLRRPGCVEVAPIDDGSGSTLECSLYPLKGEVPDIDYGGGVRLGVGVEPGLNLGP